MVEGEEASALVAGVCGEAADMVPELAAAGALARSAGKEADDDDGGERSRPSAARIAGATCVLPAPVWPTTSTASGGRLEPLLVGGAGSRSGGSSRGRICVVKMRLDSS